MSGNMFIIDDRPDWSLSEEERKKKLEDAENLLGEERVKQLSKEFDEWERERKD